MEQGSVRGSIFSLCAVAIGSGVLSLPYVLALNGYVIGIFFLLIGGIASCWSLLLIIKGAMIANVKNYS